MASTCSWILARMFVGCIVSVTCIIVTGCGRKQGAAERGRLVCIQHIRVLQQAATSYEIDHGEYPAQAHLLYPQYIKDISSLYCPLTDHVEASDSSDYKCIKEDDGSVTVVEKWPTHLMACDISEIQCYGIHIARSDGKVALEKRKSVFPENSVDLPGVRYSTRAFTIRESKLWMATELKGLLIVNLKARTLQRVATPNHQITSVTVTEDGQVWLGTLTGLFTLAKDLRLKAVRDVSALSNNLVFDLGIGPNGEVWAATTQGLAVLDKRRWRIYTVDDGLPHACVLSISITRDMGVWAGTWDGVCHYDGTEWTRVRGGSYSRNIIQVLSLVDPETLYIGTRWGVHRYRNSQWEAVHPKQLRYSHIRNLTASLDKSILIGTWGDGLYKYNPVLGDLSRIGKNLFRDIYSVKVDHHGNVWCATTRGLFRYKDEAWHFLKIEEDLKHYQFIQPTSDSQ